jgi:RNA polymerase sigma-70 factor, ECF subfamily
MMNHMTAERMARICAGDEGEYEKFVREAWSQAVRACWLILRNVQDAEEAAQDAFVNLYRYREQLREAEKFKSWFYRILMNAAKARHRRRPSVETLPEVDLAETVDRMEEAALRLSVRAAMERLSENERMAIVLCYYCGLSDREGAKAAGWALGTYKWRLAKARRQMGTEFQGDAEGNNMMTDKGGIHHA